MVLKVSGVKKWSQDLPHTKYTLLNFNTLIDSASCVG